MASNLTIDYQITGVNLYALILDDAGAIWNGSAFVAINTANWTTYAVALTESGTSGIYQVAVPALAAGIYGISVRVRAGASAATTDALAGSETLYWDGVATVLPIGAVTAGRSIALDANSRVDVGAVLGMAQTAGDLAANQTTILNRIGAFTGSGLNTILGFLRAMMRKTAALTPSDVGGTFDNTTDSEEAIGETVVGLVSPVVMNVDITEVSTS